MPPRPKAKISGDMMFTPLKKKRYSEQVAELIQNRILKDQLEIGTNLPSEKELAKEFQVSRSVVREALRILEISGLVKIRKGPAGGIFVSHVYHKPIKISLGNMITSGEVTIDHLFDVRLLIEPHIAAEAAQHATEADLKVLEDLLAESEAQSGDAAVLKKNNLDFHLLLARASGNPVCAILLESVFELLVELSFDFMDLPLEQHFFKVHKKILQVIAKKKPEEARKLLRNDILDVKKKLDESKKTARP